MAGVVAGKRPERPSNHECNDALWTLISRCWDFIPVQRPDITQVCAAIRQLEIDVPSGMHFTVSAILEFLTNFIYGGRMNHYLLS